MMPREPRLARILRRFGRLLTTGFVLLYWALFGGQVFDTLSPGFVAFIAMLAFTTACVVVGWLNDRLGGLMLVVAGVGLAVCAAVAAENAQALAVVLLSAPFLIGGIALMSAAALHEQWWYEQEGDR